MYCRRQSTTWTHTRRCSPCGRWRARCRPVLPVSVIQKGTRVLISLWDSLMFGRVPKNAAALLGTRPNISESNSEISTRVPFCIAEGGASSHPATRGSSMAHFANARAWSAMYWSHPLKVPCQITLPCQQKAQHRVCASGLGMRASRCKTASCSIWRALLTLLVQYRMTA